MNPTMLKKLTKPIVIVLSASLAFGIITCCSGCSKAQAKAVSQQVHDVTGIEYFNNLVSYSCSYEQVVQVENQASFCYLQAKLSPGECYAKAIADNCQQLKQD